MKLFDLKKLAQAYLDLRAMTAKARAVKCTSCGAQHRFADALSPNHDGVTPDTTAAQYTAEYLLRSTGTVMALGVRHVDGLLDTHE